MLIHSTTKSSYPATHGFVTMNSEKATALVNTDEQASIESLINIIGPGKTWNSRKWFTTHRYHHIVFMPEREHRVTGARPFSLRVQVSYKCTLADFLIDRFLSHS